jgi:Holliday junction resolvase RusA-like endonuclease
MYRSGTTVIRRRDRDVTVPSISKRPEVLRYQTSAALIIKAAKPSRWKPEGQIRIEYEFYLGRDADGDNLLKALNDAIESAIGVNDRWFLPCVKSKKMVPPKYAGVVVTFDDLASASSDPASSLPGPPSGHSPASSSVSPSRRP